MGITLTPILWTKDMDKKGLCPIAIRIVGNGKRTFYNTKIKVLPEHWDNGKITGGENFDILNLTLSGKISNCERYLLNKELQGEEVTIQIAKDFFNPTSTGVSFLKYAEKLISTKNEATKRRYTVELEKISVYSKGKLNFGQITPQWLTDYHNYLLRGDEAKEIAPIEQNTAINAFKVIRHAFNEAKKEKLIKSYPFSEWEYPKYEPPERKYLTIADTDRLFKLLSQDYGPDIKLVTAFFLLECFCALRVSDWCRFETEIIVKNEDLVFKAKKTGTDIRVPVDIMPSLKRIVDYIRANNLKFTRDSSYANSILKIIKPLAKIEHHTTTHLARHTCATMWLSHGVSKTSIAKMMGITEKQVETYAHFDSDKIRNEFKRLGGL